MPLLNRPLNNRHGLESPPWVAGQADDLVLFAHLIDAGSFSAAAQRVGIPKSTLSLRLSTLENRLGQRLMTGKPAV